MGPLAITSQWECTSWLLTLGNHGIIWQRLFKYLFGSLRACRLSKIDRSVSDLFFFFFVKILAHEICFSFFSFKPHLHRMYVQHVRSLILRFLLPVGDVMAEKRRGDGGKFCLFSRHKARSFNIWFYLSRQESVGVVFLLLIKGLPWPLAKVRYHFCKKNKK